MSLNCMHVNHCMFLIKVDWDKNFPKQWAMGEIGRNKIFCYWWEGTLAMGEPIY